MGKCLFHILNILLGQNCLLTEMKIYELSYQKVGYVLTIKNILFLLTVHLSGVLPSLAGNPAGWARAGLKAALTCHSIRGYDEYS